MLAGVDCVARGDRRLSGDPGENVGELRPTFLTYPSSYTFPPEIQPSTSQRKAYIPHWRGEAR